MNVRYIVALESSERQQLETLVAGGIGAVRRIKRAQILLATAAGRTDEQIATTVQVSLATVYRAKRRFVEDGMEHALSEDPRPGGKRKLSTTEEAMLVALACSSPPQGWGKWTLDLLGDEMVRLTPHEQIANVIIAETGTDMSRFPTPGHLISWAGLCPRNDESAGKRRSTRTRKSGTWLKTNLVTAAWSAVRSKQTYLRAQFLRIKSRRGATKAVMAVAASMLQAAFFMLRDGVEYRDLGSDHFDRRDKTKAIGRLLRRLGDLGCQVTIKASAATA
jgi:Transposase IS116/IS110/IS902 family/Winged helix-turn helix